MISDQAVPGDVVEFNWRTSQSGSRHGSLGQGISLPSARDIRGWNRDAKKAIKENRDIHKRASECRPGKSSRVDNAKVMGRDTLQALPRVGSLAPGSVDV